ncbi:hypothetical protein [Prosthecobacter dejongeii]|uniref:DUF4185 domain-containing protein n=1 Tax=Prosthecobacter dejongeii TaxID=48465 RepID=A0A7W7YMU4_9BACT|nr:hypothetical protein [Prosthecobacter dejongeii]MBB5039106.1 hypothetical protein [Prosthecobacter dejongeii]
MRYFFAVLWLPLMLAAAQEMPFGIQVVDAQTGRGVPLITLTTTNHQVFVTDSAGWVSFQEPGFMDTEVYFHVSGPGYSVAKDGFGYSGARLHPKAGEKTEIKVLRHNIAERLYRVTGQGIYRDSTLLGLENPLPKSNLNAAVTGQDSVQVLPWKGRLFWLWGDTNVANYPLGNFHTTCAWSDLPAKGGLEANDGVHLEYLMGGDGRVRKMVPTHEKGVVWVFGLLGVADKAGNDHLLGHYGRYERLDKRVEHGLVEFDDVEGHFRPVVQLGDEFSWQHPEGNAVRVSSKDGDFFYFVESFALTRVKADYDNVLNPASYEALAWSEDTQGYQWQSKLPPVTQLSERQQIRSGKIPEEKALLQVQDEASGKPVLIHRASINWNAYRQRWIMIATQNQGEVSMLGEVWYSEASSPEGPWNQAVKIASHPKYTFYNPRHHPFFDENGGRTIYFEGTYTETFSGNPIATPRYDYNQIMYRLDLSDPRLAVFK